MNPPSSAALPVDVCTNPPCMSLYRKLEDENEHLRKLVGTQTGMRLPKSHRQEQEVLNGDAQLVQWYRRQQLLGGIIKLQRERLTIYSHRDSYLSSQLANLKEQLTAALSIKASMEQFSGRLAPLAASLSASEKHANTMHLNSAPNLLFSPHDQRHGLQEENQALLSVLQQVARLSKMIYNHEKVISETETNMSTLTHKLLTDRKDWEHVLEYATAALQQPVTMTTVEKHPVAVPVAVAVPASVKEACKGCDRLQRELDGSRKQWQREKKQRQAAVQGRKVAESRAQKLQKLLLAEMKAKDSVLTLLQAEEKKKKKKRGDHALQPVVTTQWTELHAHVHAHHDTSFSPAPAQQWRKDETLPQEKVATDIPMRPTTQRDCTTQTETSTSTGTSSSSSTSTEREREREREREMSREVRLPMAVEGEMASHGSRSVGRGFVEVGILYGELKEARERERSLTQLVRRLRIELEESAHLSHQKSMVEFDLSVERRDEKLEPRPPLMSKGDATIDRPMVQQS
jgi:hypothetical protein